MLIRLQQTAEVVTETQFRALHKNVSFPSVLTVPLVQSFGADIVQDTPKPALTEFQTATSTVGQDGDGVWKLLWHVEYLPPEAIRQLVLANVTEQRWKVETGGITLPNGIQVMTGIDDQNRISSVVTNANLAGITEIDFKGSNGWAVIDLDTLLMIAGAIARHVQACFTGEKNHYDAVMAIQDTDTKTATQQLIEYDVTQGWPS